jgi:hypothetical protein
VTNCKELLSEMADLVQEDRPAWRCKVCGQYRTYYEGHCENLVALLIHWKYAEDHALEYSMQDTP